MNEITCSIVKDLLPLYVEGLTNEENNILIKQHLSECEDCRKIFEEIKSELYVNSNRDKSCNDKKETATVDYLKRTNKKRKHWITFGIVMALALCLSLAVVNHLFAAHPVSAEQVMIENIVVEEGKLHIDGNLRDSSYGVSSLKLSVSDGTALIDMESRLLNPFAKNSFSADFNTFEEVYSIMLGDNVIWENGITIPFSISSIYAARHEFIGDMYMNTLSVNALKMPEDLGPYKSELQTSKEPYSWTIYLENDLSKRNSPDTLNALLQFYSEMLIATIDDLDTVRFVFDSDGTTNEFIFSEADADLHYGSSVKEAAKTASGLYSMMIHWSVQ